MKTTNIKYKSNDFSFKSSVFFNVLTLILVMVAVSCKKDAKIPVIDEPFPSDPRAFNIPLDDTFSNNSTGTKELAFLDVDGDRIADFDVILSNTSERSTYSILIIGSGENQIADTTENVVKVLETERKINSSLSAWSKSGYIINTVNGELFALESDRIILTGIKVVKSGKIYFGWMKIEIPLQRGVNHSIILKSYALEQQESMAAKAGAEYL